MIMTTTKTCKKKVSSDPVVASYFGLRVVVLWKMKDYSLISFGNREFVVETSDLEFQPIATNAA